MGIFLNKAIAVVLATLICYVLIAIILVIFVVNKYSEVWFFGMSFVVLVFTSYLSDYIYDGVTYLSGEEVN